MSVTESRPSAIDLVRLPGRLAVQAAEGIASATVAVVTLPARLLSLIAAAEKGLVNLDEMTKGVKAMEGEMQGMRAHLVDVITVLEGVRSGVGSMTGEVTGIRNATVSLDSQIDGLQESLKNIDLLAARLTRFPGGRRARALKRELAEEPETA
jgi:uncharacterized protein YoxC